MQCAARSIPAQRSLPARGESMSFEPTPSVDAARKRRSSSGKRPAKGPKPFAPVDSTAARRRSTTESAVAKETPAAAYVRLSSVKGLSLRGGDDEVGDRLGIDLLEVAGLAREVGSRGRFRIRATSEKELCMQLRPPLRPARHEAHERLADLDVGADALAAEDVREGLRLRVRVVGLQVQLGQP